MIDRKFPKTLFLILIFCLLWVSVLISLNIMVKKSEGDLKIMTWNIHGGTGTDDEKDIDRTIEEIKKINPDILGLQEISDEKMIHKIADKLDMNFFFGNDFEDTEGNGLLSKYPIKEAENIYLNPGKRSSIIKAKILIDDEEWNILVTHLSLRPQEDNLIQVEDILMNVLKKNSERVILMGDFNFGPASEQYRKITTNEKIKLRDTYGVLNYEEGSTFRSNFLFRRIDFIFSSTDIEPRTSKVICSKASDHCAVITTF